MRPVRGKSATAAQSARKVLKVPRLKPPAALVDFQRWLGTAAARPLLTGNATMPQGVDGPSLAREANAKLNTVNGLSGLARLEVYNRQYWFRLITIMQEEYPCTLHVMGLDEFNAWVIRFLDAHPPSSPYLADMDVEFPGFLKRRFRGARTVPQGDLREKVLQAAAYDKALSRAFDLPGVNHEAQVNVVVNTSGTTRPGAVAAVKWVRAGHVTPVWMHWDFTAYRALCREDEELTGRFPLRRKGASGGHGVCLHRHDDTIYEKPVTRAEYLLLEALSVPRTLDQMFRAATKAATPRDVKAMERNVGAWFKTWTEMGWIGSKPS